MIYRPASAIVDRGECRRDARVARRRCSARAALADRYRIARSRFRPVPAPTFERDEAGARVYRTASRCPDRRANQAGSTARQRRRVHRRRCVGGKRRPCRSHATDGAHVAQGYDVAQRAADRRGRRDAGRKRWIGCGARELRMVGIRSVALSRPVPSSLLADVVQHCTLDADALETERAIALSDLVAMRDDMYRYPTQLAMRAAFAGHRLRNSGEWQRRDARAHRSRRDQRLASTPRADVGRGDRPRRRRRSRRAGTHGRAGVHASFDTRSLGRCHRRIGRACSRRAPRCAIARRRR